MLTHFMQGPLRVQASLARFSRQKLALVALAASMLTPVIASAAPTLASRSAPTVLTLRPVSGAYETSFEVENSGDAPTKVTGRALTSEQDTRLPPGVSVLVDGKAEGSVLAPGAKQRVQVRWTPSAGKLREVHGHIVLEGEGAKPLVLGIHGELSEGPLRLFASHGLSLVLLLPLLGALMALALKLASKNDRAAWAIATGFSAAQVLAVGALCLLFDPTVGRADGNDGFQLIERAVLLPSLGIEYFVGIDGTSLLMLLLVSVAGLSGALAGRRLELGRGGFFAAYMLAIASFSLAFAALDTALLWAGFTLALSAIALAAWQHPSTSRSTLAVRGGIVAALSSLLLGGCLWAVTGQAGRALLADGSTSERAFSLTSLLRANLLAGEPSLLGMPFEASAVVLLVLAVAPLLGLFPLTGWLRAQSIDAPTPLRSLTLAVLPALGVYVLLRLGLLVLPEGMTWASTSLAWVGAVSAILSGLAAFAERDIRALAARIATGNAALAMLGIATLSAQGAAGAASSAFAHGLCGSALAIASGLIVERLRSADSEKLEGLWRETPWLAMALGAALAAAANAPGLATFWGAWLSELPAVALHPSAAAAAVLAFLLLGGASVRMAGRLLGGELPAMWRKSNELEPFGGKLPDLATHERFALAPLLLLLVLFGLAPGPMLGATERPAFDAAAFVNPPGPAQVE